MSHSYYKVGTGFTKFLDQQMVFGTHVGRTKGKVKYAIKMEKEKEKNKASEMVYATN